MSIFFRRSDDFLPLSVMGGTVLYPKDLTRERQEICEEHFESVMTVAQIHALVKSLGLKIKNTAGHGREELIAHVVKNWEKYLPHALSLTSSASLYEEIAKGAQKLMFYKEEGFYKPFMASYRPVFYQNFFEELADNDPTMHQCNTLTIAELKDFLEHVGWHWDSRFNNQKKFEAVKLTMRCWSSRKESMTAPAPLPVADITVEEEIDESSESEGEEVILYDDAGEPMALSAYLGLDELCGDDGEIPVVMKPTDDLGFLGLTPVKVAEFNGKVLLKIGVQFFTTTILEAKQVIVQHAKNFGKNAIGLDEFYISLRTTTKKLGDEDVITEEMGIEGFSVHLRLRAGGKEASTKKEDAVKKKELKNAMVKQTRKLEAENLLACAKKNATYVNESAMADNQCIKSLANMVEEATKMGEKSGIHGMEYFMGKVASIDALDSALDSLDPKKARTKSVDVRIRNCAKQVMGDDMKKTIQLQLSVNASVETATACFHHIFLRCGEDDPSFDVSSLKQIITNRIAFLKGQASGSNTDGLEDAMQAMQVG